MADRARSIPSICRELGDVPASTPHHYLHADSTLKAPGLKLLGGAVDVAAPASQTPAAA